MQNQLHERKGDNSPSVFPNERFPLAPDSIRDAYNNLWSNCSYSQNELESKQRKLTLTNTLLSDFCDKYIPTSLYSASMLSSMFDDATTDSDQVLKALKQYSDNPSETDEQKRYVFGILSDQIVTDNFWSDNVASQYADDSVLLHILESDEPEVVDDELWSRRAKLVSPSSMNELVDSVNLESLLVKSAKILTELNLQNASKNSQTLKHMYQAEALYAPLCEIVGFDGLAMALQSQVYVLRAIYTKDADNLSRARSLIAERGDAQQVDQDVQSLFSTIFGDHIHEQVIDHTAPHGIIIGDGLCTSANLRVIWRLKSVGSLINKLQKIPENETTPLDIIGATIITKNQEQLAERLGRIIERSHSDENVRLTPTHDRTDAVHIKGTADYLETIREGLGFDSLDSMKRFVDVVEVQPGEFRVCKVTLVYKQETRPDLRAEIQLTTENDRIEARIGSAAHLLYKFASSSTEPINPKYLRVISRRKENLNKNNMTLRGQSNARGKQLRERVAEINS